MDLMAATATGDGPGAGFWLRLAAFAAVAAVLYAGACVFWPFTACGKCKGSARFKSPTGKNWRRCNRCKGTGGRVRTGRRILDWLNITAQKAK